MSIRWTAMAGMDIFENCRIFFSSESVFNFYFCSSAMYYISNIPKKIDQFLEMGTYIGMQNGTPTPNVSFIAPAALEAHFNNCINFVQSEDNKKVTYIEFDYTNLIPPRNVDDDDEDRYVMPNEMIAIQFISQSVDYKHLLVHPLIWSFISLKWRQLELFRNIDCALYVLFALSNLCYILALRGNAPEDITNIFFILTGTLTFYVVGRQADHNKYNWNISHNNDRSFASSLIRRAYGVEYICCFARRSIGDA